MKTLQIILLLFSLVTLNIQAQQASFGGHADTTVSKSLILSNLCLEIEGYPNAVIIKYQVTFGSMQRYVGPYYSNEKCLDDQGTQYVWNMSRGQKLYVDYIEAVEPDGWPLRPKPFYIRLD